MTIAIIPARGGSKRIPRKNLREFRGKPIIAYSVEAAISSGCFERIIVTTDDDEIAACARDLGAEVPFVRPAELSNDYATTVDVVTHAVRWLVSANAIFDFACCIYATAPFLTAEDLSGSFAKLRESEFNYVLSATRFGYPVFRGFTVTADNAVNMLFPQHVKTRSQDLDDAWHDAGQFYWGRKQAWLSGAPILSDRSSIHELPRSHVQDIDTFEDWELAEKMHQIAFPA